MRKKRFMILVLSVIVGGTFLVGCGNSKTATTNQDNNKEEKTILVGTSPDYYPWCYTQNGNLQGFEIDVWNEIGKRADYKVEFKQSKFAGLFGMLDASQIDTVAHQISTTPEREEKYNFTETYAYSGYSFVIKKDSDYSKIEDFKGKKIGCTLGGNGEKTLKKISSEKELGLDIATYDQTPMENDVEIGRLDAAWIGTVKAKTVIEKEKMDLKLYDPKYVFEVNQYPFKKDDKNKQKIEDTNKAIKSMHEDGTFTELSMKWFGLDTTKSN
ncbi:transporter substrate-binding domain-containing protein [Clostridium algidicarnis]|nr:transporter substrate-binding domain-containing protein [Clostridium algidicarnis]MBU3250833.1 transporter substrate-binding domain-containing protein [Clostridium algidicarnis]